MTRKLDRHADSLTAAAEAIEVERRLAEAGGRAGGRDLGFALINYAIALVALDRLPEGVAAGRAVRAGADAVATTLSGYTPASPPTDGPDLTLVARLAGALAVPVIAEGRYRDAEQIGQAFAAGAHSVVMGNAVTSPLWITRRLVPATPAAAGSPDAAAGP
ncbi:hypothetical protein [Micromonospora sp. NPDC005173]|uniref:hypothetical protein n=1 Tax=Micromonospora sp. NPDC005173 TaxID=3157165 RepID=UPI0033AFA626